MRPISTVYGLALPLYTTDIPSNLRNPAGSYTIRTTPTTSETTLLTPPSSTPLVPTARPVGSESSGITVSPPRTAMPLTLPATRLRPLLRLVSLGPDSASTRPLRPVFAWLVTLPLLGRNPLRPPRLPRTLYLLHSPRPPYPLCLPAASSSECAGIRYILLYLPCN